MRISIHKMARFFKPVETVLLHVYYNDVHDCTTIDLQYSVHGMVRVGVPFIGARDRYNYIG